MKKILVIDDAEFILESTSTLLRFEGYDVYTASDGLDGINLALQQIPDLILCDISMPNLDGYGVLEKIRGYPQTATIPFIFLTAFTEKSNMRAGMEKGADDFLIKPYTRDELIAAIDAQWKKLLIIEKQLKEKVEEVGRSVNYALPHEFRTVLNQVVNSAKYLKSNPESIKPEELIETSSDIISSAQRLLRITENFLTYVRVESFSSNPEMKRQLRNYRTDEPVAMIYDFASVIAEKYDRLGDIFIEVNIDSITAEISTESFHKITDELIDNSFKFSDKHTKVIVKSWLYDNYIFFSISDKGRGMSHEQISKVGAYMQFERAMYEQQGIGLGLVIAKRLVEIHDGSFNIQSEEGIGTTITFSLPCRMIS